MGFNEDLQAISSQRSEIEKAKRAALRDFQVACRPAKEYALAAIPRLEEFFAKTVRPFVAQIKAAGVPDMEIRNCLFEIDQLLKKPDELRMHLRELESVDWEQINQTVYPHELDIFRRNALQRHLIHVLSKFGDVEGCINFQIGRIRTQVQQLVDAGRIGQVSQSVSIAPNTSPS